MGRNLALIMADIRAAEQQYRATLQALWASYKGEHSRLPGIKQVGSLMHMLGCALRAVLKVISHALALAQPAELFAWLPADKRQGLNLHVIEAHWRIQVPCALQPRV